MKKGKRERICLWCCYGTRKGLYYCTREPKWLQVDKLHYCGRHKWNREGSEEIRAEILGD